MECKDSKNFDTGGEDYDGQAGGCLEINCGFFLLLVLDPYSRDFDYPFSEDFDYLFSEIFEIFETRQHLAWENLVLSCRCF
jgi:hypothetical protein